MLYYFIRQQRCINIDKTHSCRKHPSMTILIHTIFAFWTLISGFLVFISSDQKIWGKSRIWLYTVPHLLTAITGLLMGQLTSISPFKVLSALTIYNFIRAWILINKGEYTRARANMLGAYVGLCIAFIGTLHPYRLLGSIFLIDTLGFDVDLATNIWGFAMITSVVAGTIVGAISVGNTRKLSQKLQSE